MLIDDLLPDADASEKHHITIMASPEAVYDALWNIDFGGIRSVRLLLALRALPGRLLKPHRRRRPTGRFDLLSLEAAGFGKIAEAPGREVVFGVTGRFWRPVGNILPFQANAFDEPVAPGLARAVWNLAVTSSNDDSTILSTETRIICGDPSSRRKFRLYWLIVKPFSGLIRRMVLKSVKKSCERGPES
ncbi:MAG: hypothetical protein V3S30_04200 [Thermoanaerobaculia bacterium]